MKKISQLKSYSRNQVLKSRIKSTFITFLKKYIIPKRFTVHSPYNDLKRLFFVHYIANNTFKILYNLIGKKDYQNALLDFFRLILVLSFIFISLYYYKIYWSIYWSCTCLSIVCHEILLWNNVSVALLLQIWILLIHSMN